MRSSQEIKILWALTQELNLGLILLCAFAFLVAIDNIPPYMTSPLLLKITWHWSSDGQVSSKWKERRSHCFFLVKDLQDLLMLHQHWKWRLPWFEQGTAIHTLTYWYLCANQKYTGSWNNRLMHLLVINYASKRHNKSNSLKQIWSGACFRGA